MDAVLGIKFSSEPDESLVPAVFQVDLLLGRLGRVEPSPLPRGSSCPLGTRRGRDGCGKGDFR